MTTTEPPAQELEIVSPVDAQLVRYAAETGLEKPATQTLVDAFRPIFAKARSAMDSARGVAESVIDATCVTEIRRSRECRLALRKVRLESDEARKMHKQHALLYGRAVDGFHNILMADLSPVETRLQEAEDVAERAEAERKAKLKTEREAALKLLGVDVSFYQLGDMPAPQFTALLENTKLAHQAKLDAAAKVEADRIAKEKADAEERERERLENERLKKEAVEREAAAKAEREAAAARLAEQQHQADLAAKEAARVAAEEKAKADAAAEAAAAEAKRLAEIAVKEKAEVEAKAKAEREAAQKKLDEQKAAADKAAKEAAAKAAKEKAEMEARAKADREEAERLAKIERDRVAAEAQAAQEALEAAALKERNARLKLEAEAKAARDAEAEKVKATELAAKKAAAAPDKQKLQAVADVIRAIPMPHFSTLEGKNIGDGLNQEFENLVSWIEERAATL